MAIMLIEHPYLGPKEIAAMVRHRIEMRHFFPSKFKTAAHARGEKYEVDSMEDYREDLLDPVELEALRRQRARRHIIGIITITSYDKEKNMFYYEGYRDCDTCELGPPPCTTAEGHRAICMREKDI
jgi:hypothetical protein